MKITSHVQAFDAKSYMDFFYKTFIDGGLVHLWFTARARSHYSYEPDFSMSYWDHIASWPLEMPFEEGVVPDLIAEWLEWCRPHGQLDIDKIAELALEHLMDIAYQENKEWDRMKAWKEKRRAEELADVLTA